MAIRCQNKSMWENGGRISQKMFIDKQKMQKEVRSENLIIFNFIKIGNA